MRRLFALIFAAAIAPVSSACGCGGFDPGCITTARISVSGRITLGGEFVEGAAVWLSVGSVVPGDNQQGDTTSQNGHYRLFATVVSSNCDRSDNIVGIRVPGRAQVVISLDEGCTSYDVNYDFQ